MFFFLVCFLLLKNCCWMNSIKTQFSFYFCSAFPFSKWCSIQLNPNVYYFLIILVLFCDRALLSKLSHQLDHQIVNFWHLKMRQNYCIFKYEPSPHPPKKNHLKNHGLSPITSERNQKLDLISIGKILKSKQKKTFLQKQLQQNIQIHTMTHSDNKQQHSNESATLHSTRSICLCSCSA